MSITRRGFVRAGLLTMVAGACLKFPPAAFGQKLRTARDYGDGFAVPYKSQLEPLFNFNQQTFEAHLHTPFELSGGADGPITVMLEELRECGSKASAPLLKRATRIVPTECFSLHFRGASEKPLKEGIYDFEHGALGRFQLFITIGGDSKLGPVYVAVINHRRG